jgi:hypothetical protein
MSLSAPKAPAAPDPAATSAAQTTSNKETALYNFGLNNSDYNTPYGSLTYDLDTSDPNQPKSTANVTLAPDQQTLLENQNQQSIGLSNLANELQGRVGDTLSQPLPTSADINALSDDATKAYYAKQTAMLDPQYGNMEKQMEAKLANQGITQGSEAWRNAQDEFGRQRTYAYDQAQQNAVIQGPQNASALFSLNSSQRNQPLNEFNALRTGSQVTSPQVPGQTPVNMAGTNVAGNINQGYQNQLGVYNSQVGQQNATMGGLFSLGGSLGAAAIMSDIRLKKNIRKLGKTPAGINIYEFEYKNTSKKHIGVMAQEVEQAIPEAVVIMSSGFKAVRYGMVR